jgi:hypothetical protein
LQPEAALQLALQPAAALQLALQPAAALQLASARVMKVGFAVGASAVKRASGR